jgi:plasmid stabilization system protein ParE
MPGVFSRNLNVVIKFRVNITRNAQVDLEHIYSYIAEDSINKANKFILELEEKISSLGTFPERSSYIPENIFFGANYRHLIHKNYRVIYRVEVKTVYILRIVHGTKLLEL